MKNVKRLVVATMLMLSLFLGAEGVKAAGCGTYYIYSTSTPKCYSEHCGIWDTTALVQYQYKKRKCVRNDNTDYWQYQTDRVHIDCGC